MIISTRYLVFCFLILAVPLLVVVGWWYYYPHYQLAQAEKAFRAGNYPAAEEKTKLLIQDDPKNLRALFLYVQVMRRQNRPVEAQTALLQAMNLGLPEAQGRREFALAEAAKEFSPNAEKNLRQVLEEQPKDVEILEALAKGYAETNRWDDANTYYSRWLNLEPDRWEILLARGKHRLNAVSHQSGRNQDAAADFREVLKRSPDNFEAHLMLSHCFLADARMPEAKEELLICQKLDAGRVEVWVGLAACALEERDWEEAEKLLKKAKKLDPKSIYVISMQGDVHLRRQQAEPAIAAYRQVIAVDPRHKGARLKLAQALRLAGRNDEAKEQEKVYETLAEKDPNYNPLGR
jgi:predicted Zn-dependent protease